MVSRHLPLHQPTTTVQPGVSVVIPLYNEADGLELLLEQLLEVMRPMGEPFELVLIDDGSTDGTDERLQQLARDTPELVAVLLRRNYGQTPAMAAGFDVSRGRVIVTMDGDLQNDPDDIPRIVNRLREGYDLVSGWRHQRQDKELSRKLPSKLANRLIGKVTGVRLHDYGCSLKAYRRELVEDMNLYGELHRFLPALASIEGARIDEIKVSHRARQFGQSKYGIDRTFRVLMDLLTIWFLQRFLTQPMHVFGFAGLLAIITSVLMSFYLLVVKLAGNDIGARPLLLLSVVLGLAGVQMFCLGLLGEMLMRTYHESQNRSIYRIRQVLRGGGPGAVAGAGEDG
ncbi:MAG: glycosyltransferase family 2 protein [Cyanobacteria bacterium MAG CAR2_bin_4]|nr:glycosyltransferase family 2 protein [Cyanobacteria bacterium MAG CAR2_bin_4]